MDKKHLVVPDIRPFVVSDLKTPKENRIPVKIKIMNIGDPRTVSDATVAEYYAFAIQNAVTRYKDFKTAAKMLMKIQKGWVAIMPASIATIQNLIKNKLFINSVSVLQKVGFFILFTHQDNEKDNCYNFCSPLF